MVPSLRPVWVTGTRCVFGVGGHFLCERRNQLLQKRGVSDDPQDLQTLNLEVRQEAEF